MFDAEILIVSGAALVPFGAPPPAPGVSVTADVATPEGVCATGEPPDGLVVGVVLSLELPHAAASAARAAIDVRHVYRTTRRIVGGCLLVEIVVYRHYAGGSVMAGEQTQRSGLQAANRGVWDWAAGSESANGAAKPG